MCQRFFFRDTLPPLEKASQQCKRGPEREHSRGGFERFEPQCQKTYLLTYAPNEDSNQHAHLRSPNRIFIVRIKKLWLSTMRMVKILIKLRTRAHARRYVS